MKVAIISSSHRTYTYNDVSFHTYTWTDQIDVLRKINLRDYDGVVINLSGLSATTPSIAEIYSKISPEIIRDIIKGDKSFIYIIGNPSTILHNRTIVNRLELAITKVDGGGESLQATEYYKKFGFEPYLSNLKNYTYSYMDSKLSPQATTFSNSKYYLYEYPLITTRAGHSVASLFDIMNRTDNRPAIGGYIGLFPELNSISPEDDIELLLKCRFVTNSDISEPEWTEKIEVYGQKEIDKQIQSTKEKLSSMSISLKDLENSRVIARNDIKILYEMNKPLEKAIKESLSAIGINIIEPKNDNKVEFRIEQNKHKIVVEVKSTSKATIDQKGLRQVIDWQNDAYDETGNDYMPVVIVSNETNKQPDDRTSELLPDNLIKYANTKNITVISVSSIFNAIQDIKAGKINVDLMLTGISNARGIIVYDNGSFKQAQANK